eukprot:4885069-Amphidinium_carterae.1
MLCSQGPTFDAGGLSSRHTMHFVLSLMYGVSCNVRRSKALRPMCVPQRRQKFRPLRLPPFPRSDLSV